MGFLNAIKRWRLARQGLSSGRKRRVHSENLVIQVLEDSFWVKLSLYAIFLVTSCALVMQAPSDSSFSDNPVKAALYSGVIALTALVMFHQSGVHACRRNSRVILVLGGLIGHLAIVRLILSFPTSADLPDTFGFLFIPFALVPMLHSVLLGRTVGSFSTIFVSFIGCLFVARHDVVGFLIVSLISGMTAVILTDQIRKRVQLLRAGIYVGAVTLILAFVLGRLDMTTAFGSDPVDALRFLGKGCAAVFGTGVVTALLISGFLPIFEGFFRITTDISWLELSDLNHKLLRQMQLEAPGTFHHSLVVASLSEAAAEKIGANAVMCRVCSYFHDVGKLKKPSYFIENQHDGGENPHDALTPTMSALIIIAHVKDGVDLAVKHKLNPRIIDVIQEHHGDSLVAYFYRRAQEQKKAEMEKVDRKLENPEDLPQIGEKNFRYPGPRPGSRESAIISLADGIESASRCLTKPTPARIRQLVEDIVRSRLNDHQLDDCPLTLQELAIVKESFASTLRSMMHSRIDYPKDDTTPGGKRSSDIQRPTPTERFSDASRGGRTARLENV